MRRMIAVVVVAAASLLIPRSALAAPGDARLVVTVVDASGAVIVGARVTISRTGDGVLLAAAETGSRGESVFPAVEPGRYSIRVEAAGFAASEVTNVRVRAGDNRREVKTAVARFTETVDVGRDAQTQASDPRSGAFDTVLGQSQIDELPDDPDEMEQMLKDMAGPGAVLRVNGFRGGRLPPKSQIQQIRFRRNMFAADSHEAGAVSVDIVTRPGLNDWQGSTTVGLRNHRLDARNVFAPVKGDARQERFGFTLNGPLWRQHTSLALTIDGADTIDSATIVAALPSGYHAETIRRPDNRLNLTARLEHAVTAAQLFRAEIQRNRASTENIGVGGYDLPERGYAQAREELVLRGSVAGSIGSGLFNDLRVQARGEALTFTPASGSPAVLVADAFSAGGAQIAGRRETTLLEVADDLDINAGRHGLRAGIQVEAGRYRTSERRNATGTFTFASLDDYAAGTPTTFSRNVGNPDLAFTQLQAGIYIQDDIRLSPALTLSAGARQEYQSHIGGLHLAPRGGLTWSPLKSGKTTIRAGAGVFFDWLEAETYLQARQLDGSHQEIETTLRPGYPDATLGGSILLPAGRVHFAPDLAQPELRQTMVGIEQQLPGEIRLNGSYLHRVGANVFRAANINAPDLDGVRPYPGSGPINEISTSARSRFDALSVNINYARPAQRLFIAANYTLARAIDETDGPFSLPASTDDLAAERGPATSDTRHRFMSLANLPLFSGLRLGSSLRLQSALPYNITTGRDDNGDTSSTDRPAGVTRNSGRGRPQVDLSMRLSWVMGLGARRESGPGEPQIRIVRGDNPDPLGGMIGSDGADRRYSLELYAQAYNLTNHVNATSFSGVITSPFFGQPTAARAARRIDVGVRVGFR